MRTIDGIINLYKPRGNTSFQMVALARKLTGIRKVGHSGTLDPDATGVLPILIGRATRIASFLLDSNKVYQAEIAFGRTTTTDDSSGITVSRSDCAGLTREAIEVALEHFRGAVEQIPPMYSAIKYKGRPLYQLARSGIEIDRTPRMVQVFRFEIQDWQPPYLRAEIECSKGTYVRTLAHDLGAALGCGAFLNQLVRLRTGPFHIDRSVPPEELEARFRNGTWRSVIQPMDTALVHLAYLTVDDAGEMHLEQGRPVIPLEQSPPVTDAFVRAYSQDGRFLALVRFDPETGAWQPRRVFI